MLSRFVISLQCVLIQGYTDSMNRTSPDSERIIITISKADRARLDELAFEDDRSLSGYCRRVLHDHVLKHPKESDAEKKQG